MLIYDKNKIEKFDKWSDSNIHILMDFDRTITSGDSIASWGILSKSDLVPKEYASDRQKIYEFYRPIEKDESMDFQTKNKYMIEWWEKHINLLIKYKISKEVIDKAATNMKVMKFRDGAKEFLENMYKRNIPVIIISAGIGNFVKQFLINNNCYFDNIYIISNFLTFENGVASGISTDIVHSLNKDLVKLPDDVLKIIKNRDNIILFGDNTSDVCMAKKEVRDGCFKIGFLDENISSSLNFYRNVYDVVCTDNTSFSELMKEFNVLGR